MYREYTKYDSDPLSDFGADELVLGEMGTTPLFLAAAANQYLDTTVTKFMDQQ